MPKLLAVSLLLLTASWLYADTGHCRQNAATPPNVTCCCRTAHGGLCCGEMGVCGTWIPGCLCAP